MEAVLKYLWLFLTSFWIYGLVEGQSIDNNLEGIGAFMDPCRGLKCQNFGRCEARNSRPVCVCPHHTRGSRCEDKVPDLCSKCWPPGTKICNARDGFCECKAYYYGRTCQSVNSVYSRGFFKQALDDEILRKKKQASSFLERVRQSSLRKIPGDEALNVPAQLDGNLKKDKDNKQKAIRKVIRKMMKERLKKALLPKN
ncbi:unnamed protein product [Owenia fusiformis]|uniref:Uncharacterized protein n=1 Tax=Owenia fusiformis TaxID=6347 RepID=A0A8J1UC79_OWEFU|nr:unnamed protein product [Owenia fusiformis]